MTILSEDIESFYNEQEEWELEEQDVRVLKALVSDKDIAREFCHSYDSSIFLGHAKSFAEKVISLQQLYGNPPTKRIMLDLYKDQQEEIKYIWNILDSTEYNSAEFKYDLDKIKDRFVRNKVISVRNCIDNLDLSDTPAIESILSEIKSGVDSAQKIRKGKEKAFVQKTIKEYLPEFRQEYILKSQNPELGKGVSTGYSFLDYITNGLQPSDMLLIGADTGGGKSQMLINMALQMWMQQGSVNYNPNKLGKGFNIQYFSLEMPYEQCFRRFFSRLSQVSTYALRDCQVHHPDAIKRMSQAANFIKSFPFEFEIVDIPRGVTVQSIEDRFLEAASKNRRPDVVIVDYLGLMASLENFKEDWLKLGEIASQLHEFARAYNVIVLSAVQLNRPKGKDSGEAIGLHRIGRSSQIMHHATVGIQIEKRDDEETYQDLIYHVIKNRNGESGGSHVLKKDFAKATLVDLEQYLPKVDEAAFRVVNPGLEDISAQLEKFGWA